ncbi:MULTISPECIES: hypothetical protein [Elizabethkingia]|uniref:Uncharacterized protein n=1 Tax=Elizabethkingia miricola TaxID=172045 RepID=A0ABD5B3T3_ELIMR|nr:hypothetical protein [Elizabethkingia miricola]MDQ8748320.1 hypothetical protein [Elizabethkingia miricola]NHQ68242.1 hypothetical protein [Elizabethkingia miricola]NHQ71992.1 hypothetical protein [Elizabethkingia miricola]NHQ79551.1 hypothetical protein [Elizabethkingia miricola]OPB88045.1 hypothetical protein BAS06_12740 [Elizabethkingia miricola]
MDKEKDTSEYLIQKIVSRSLYKTPEVEVTLVEIEQGIAAGSASAMPNTTNGNTNAIQTNWNGNDDTSIDTPF